MTKTISNKRALVGIITGVVILVLLAAAMESKVQAKWQGEQLASVMISLEALTKDKREIADVDIAARAAIVYDIKSGKTLYTKNADAQLALASLTKIVTALVADEELGAKRQIQVTEQALATEGVSGLVAGESWSERDLSDFMLIVSSNDAASALAMSAGDRQQFIIKMNHLAKRLGLTSVTLLNESGLDADSRRAGGYGSVRDMAHLLAYITLANTELLEATTLAEFIGESSSGLRYKAINTNKIVGEIPGLIGGKTGYTDLAGGNLAIVFDAGIGRPIAVVVLGSTKMGRFDDVLKLVNNVLR